MNTIAYLFLIINQALLDFLLSFATEHKKALFEEALRWRTRYLTVVIENTHQSQNTSAILRTCECFGLQDIHFITEKYGEFVTNKKADKDALKWLNVQQHTSTQRCFDTLKAQDYQLVATSPNAKWCIDDLPISSKTALVFDAESTGLDNASIKQADELVSIPMYGFTESFNLSVSVALVVRSLVERLHRSDFDWQLSDQERYELQLDWVLKSIRNPDALMNYFYENHGKT